MTTSLELRPTPPQIIGPAAPAHSFGDLERMAQVIATGGLFPALKNPAQALSLMLLCQAKNLHPMEAVERYHIGQGGRPIKQAWAILADFIDSGGRVEWHERTDATARATFSHPAGGTITVEWTLAQAKAAGLTNKDIWKSYPRQMLSARCIAEGCRAIYPGSTDGLYTMEEAVNMPPLLPVEAPATAAIAAAPQIEAPKPRPLNICIRGFWQAADAKGFVIRGEDGKVSNELVQALATRVRGGAIPETGADWDAAREALDYPPADIVEINTDDIVDPFAEDAEPALLAVPADPTPEPVAASPFVDAPIRKGRI